MEASTSSEQLAELEVGYIDTIFEGAGELFDFD
jgi:hypothetical protein